MRGKDETRGLSRRASGITPARAGKRLTLKQLHRQLGITPARAGKSRPPGRRAARRWDHPRACGEKPAWNRPRCCCPWITPARAGKRMGRFSLSRSGRDHPRACGEKFVLVSCHMASRGSPPRVRGKGNKSFLKRLGIGITPARAGKRWHHAGPCAWPGDHPRACGEKRSCRPIVSGE